MMLRRSDAGLSAEHVLYGVDFIVHVEGPTEPNEAGLEGTMESAVQLQNDISFWNSIISLTIDPTRFHVRVGGNKSTLTAISQKIAAGSVHNVVVAMDTDFDEVLQTKIQHPRVLYTHGYSWENDVLCDAVAREVVHALIPNPRVATSTYEEWSALVRREQILMKRLVKIDILAQQISTPFLDRQRPSRFIVLTGPAAGCFRKDQILACIRHVQGSRPVGLHLHLAAAITTVIECPRHVCGKIFLRKFYHWLVSKLRELDQVTPPVDTIAGMARQFFEIHLTRGTGEECIVHYAESCARLQADL